MLSVFYGVGTENAYLSNKHENSVKYQGREEFMIPYFENVLRHNQVSDWRHTLEKFRVSFSTAMGARSEKKVDEADLNQKADEMDWRERTGGWWW